VESEDAFNSDV